MAHSERVEVVQSSNHLINEDLGLERIQSVFSHQFEEILGVGLHNYA